VIKDAITVWPMPGQCPQSIPLVKSITSYQDE